MSGWPRSTRGMSLSLVVVALAMVLGCAPAATPAPAGTAKPAADSAAKAADLDRLAAAAKQEGELVLLGPPNQELRTILNDTFGKRFGIKVSYFGGSSELFAKLKAERAADQFTSDVILNASPNLLPLKDEVLAPLRPALVLPEVTTSSNWVDDHLWWTDPEEQKLLRLGVYVIVNLVVNTDMVKPESIRTWDDVLDPKYKGKITSMTLKRAGPGAGTASYLWVALGEQKFKQLYVDQAVAFTDEARQAAENVARGSHPIGLGLDASVIEPLRKQGLKLEVVRPPDAPGYLSSGWATLGLIDRAPHPNAAALFVNWAASKEGNEAINRPLESVSSRKDATNDWAPEYTRAKPGAKYVDTHSHVYLTDTRAKADQGVRAIMGN